MKSTQVSLLSALILGVALFVAAPSSLNADASALDPGFKIGIMAGYPSALTAGYRFSPDFEINAFLGTRYANFDLGANVLFRIATPAIQGDPFPIGIGPQIMFGLSPSDVELGAVFLGRIENTLRVAPLNLFFEFGLGLNIVPVTQFTAVGAIGLRFVFDHPITQNAVR